MHVSVSAEFGAPAIGGITRTPSPPPAAAAAHLSAGRLPDCFRPLAMPPQVPRGQLVSQIQTMATATAAAAA